LAAGQVVELAEPVVDPENFARDLHRLIGSGRSALTLWNSITTLVTGYHEQGGLDVTLYLVNYANQPDNVQVQVKGRFARVSIGISRGTPAAFLCLSLNAGGSLDYDSERSALLQEWHLDSARESSAAP